VSRGKGECMNAISGYCKSLKLRVEVRVINLWEEEEVVCSYPKRDSHDKFA
jgi:hypothetical protein